MRHALQVSDCFAEIVHGIVPALSWLDQFSLLYPQLTDRPGDRREKPLFLAPLWDTSC